jgi:hypothetical protein
MGYTLHVKTNKKQKQISYFSHKFTRFAIYFITFLVGFWFFSFIEAIVFVLFLAAILTKKGSYITGIGAIIGLILIPIFTFIEDTLFYIFPLFGAEDLAIGVYFLLVASVASEAVLYIIEKINPLKDSSQDTAQNPSKSEYIKEMLEKFQPNSDYPAKTPSSHSSSLQNHTKTQTKSIQISHHHHLDGLKKPQTNTPTIISFS